MTKPKSPFDGKLFDVEHAFSLYAHSFASLPAELIYDKAKLLELGEVTNNCHIYMIGYLPRFDIISASQSGNVMTTVSSILGHEVELDWPLSDGMKLVTEGELIGIETLEGEIVFPQDDAHIKRLKAATDLVVFNVKYIGQAYGTDSNGPQKLDSVISAFPGHAAILAAVS